MKTSRTAKRSASALTNGSIPIGAVPRPPKKKATGCAGQRKRRPTALRNSGRSRKLLARSFWSVIWICLRRVPTKLMTNDGRSSSSCDITTPPVNSMRSCVQDDYSVIGSEFCYFLSTLLTFRLIDAFDKAGLLEDYTYRKILSVLIRTMKARVGSENAADRRGSKNKPKAAPPEPLT